MVADQSLGLHEWYIIHLILYCHYNCQTNGGQVNIAWLGVMCMQSLGIITFVSWKMNPDDWGNSLALFFNTIIRLMKYWLVMLIFGAYIHISL